MIPPTLPSKNKLQEATSEKEAIIWYLMMKIENLIF
jgi:hypothetical protein